MSEPTVELDGTKTVYSFRLAGFEAVPDNVHGGYVVPTEATVSIEPWDETPWHIEVSALGRKVTETGATDRRFSYKQLVWSSTAQGSAVHAAVLREAVELHKGKPGIVELTAEATRALDYAQRAARYEATKRRV